MSAKQRDSGSKIEQYAAKPAAYDHLYSTGGDDDATKQAARDRKQAAANNRHLRWASSHGDLRATLRLDENAKLPGNRNGGGVGDALENDSRDRQTGQARTREGLVLEEQARKRAAAELGNNSPASPPVPVPGGAVAPAGGSGGSPTPPAGPSAPAPAATPPVAQGGAGKGKPAPMEWETNRKNAIEEQVNNLKRPERIKKLGEDLKIWGKQTEGGPDFDEIEAYGKTLGLTEEDIRHELDKNEREEKERDVPITRQNRITGVMEVDNEREASRKMAEEAIADFEKEKKSREDMTIENFPESFKNDEDNRKLVADQIEENVKNYVPPVHPDHQASEAQMIEPLTGSDTLMPTRSAKEPTPEEAKAAKATAALAKTYGDYLNGEGKQLNGESADAWRARKDSKYDEITGKTPAKSVNPETTMLLKRHGKITSQLQDIESRESAFFA